LGLGLVLGDSSTFPGLGDHLGISSLSRPRERHVAFCEELACFS